MSFEEEKTPTVVLMGRRRSGKSSIIESVFHNMKPWESVYLESTSKPEVLNVASLINVDIMELPGQIDYLDGDYDTISMFKQTEAIIYVIDAQDEYYNAVRNLIKVIEIAYLENPNIRVEVLVHKIDGLSEEFRDNTVRDIKDRTDEMLYDGGLELFQGIEFYQTSIYDQSIYEVLSKIISRLIPELSDLERLLDSFVQHCQIEKAFLCDLRSKLYFATDSSPLDSKIYEVCSEFIDMSIDLDGLVCTRPDPIAFEDNKIDRSNADEDDEESRSLTSFEYDNTIKKSNGIGSLENKDNLNKGKRTRLRCVSRLSPGLKLYLQEMLPDMCLIAYIRDEDALSKTMDESTFNSVLDYNASVLRKSMESIFSKA